MTTTTKTTPSLLLEEVSYFKEIFAPTREQLAILTYNAKRNSKALATMFTDLYDGNTPWTVQGMLEYYGLA